MKLLSRISTEEPMLEMRNGALSSLSISMVVQPTFLSSVAIMSDWNVNGKPRNLDIKIRSKVTSISPIGISFSISNATIENSSVVVSGTSSQGIFVDNSGFRVYRLVLQPLLIA